MGPRLLPCSPYRRPSEMRQPRDKKRATTRPPGQMCVSVIIQCLLQNGTAALIDLDTHNLEGATMN